MDQSGLDELLRQVKGARGDLSARDKRLDSVEAGLNDVLVRLNRPGAEGYGGGFGLERKEARAYAIERHNLLTQKDDGGGGDYEPSASEVDAAISATRALRKVIRYGVGRLDGLETKSLSSFNFGSVGWALPPAWSSRILSCLDDASDLAGLVSTETISGGSIKFPVDNQEFDQSAAWACQTDCFANNPSPQIQNLGELEIKAEELRFAICSGTDLLEDAAFNVEQWLQRKVANGFRDAISRAIVHGTGLGMPQGILTPGSGVPVCETIPNTPPGTFTLQDLVMLGFEVPQKWHDGLVYVMNQRTLALCATMSDAIGRPLLVPSANESARGQFLIGGWRVTVASQMPDVIPGATPVLAANLRELYALVLRKGTSMTSEPIGWCRMFRFSNRTGGAVLCPNAGRLLRIK